VGVAGINHVTLATADVEGAVAFYSDVLGCRILARWPTGAYVLAGQLWLALVEGPSETRGRGDYSHFAFDVDAHEFAALAAAVVASGAEVWQDNRSEGESLYFRDPDGHQLEIHATSLAARLESAREAPWPGLEVMEGAAAAARRQPTVADRRKPRRFACSPMGVFVVVFDDEDRALVLRPPGDDRFQVPNGAVEADEDPADAARRELVEEAGPIATGPLWCFSAYSVDYDDLLPRLTSIGFVTRYVSGTPLAGDDMLGSEVRWAGLDELAPKTLFIPGDPERLRQALRVLRASEQQGGVAGEVDDG
jgi:catechol 2,3-dioxygenase-like lactoylglutathione lyase family enzyme/8-oxo-dGTP pyrophosphatase MutT (NUDIX family)